MIKSFKELKEGKSLEISEDIITLEVSKNIPESETKIDKEEKQTFEEFKILYKGQIDDKCLEDYGTLEDAKLWEDVAKELYLQSSTYIPNEEVKPEKIEEAYVNYEDPNYINPIPQELKTSTPLDPWSEKDWQDYYNRYLDSRIEGYNEAQKDNRLDRYISFLGTEAKYQFGLNNLDFSQDNYKDSLSKMASKYADNKKAKYEKARELSETKSVEDNKDINSLMIIYTSDQTYPIYYNFRKGISKEEIQNIKSKLINKEMSLNEFRNNYGAEQVISKKELIGNTAIIRLKEGDNEGTIDIVNEDIDRSSVAEKKLLNLVQVVNSVYNLENIQMERTPDGKAWHIITTDGKDIVTVNGSYWDEDELEDLRINGYIVEKFEEASMDQAVNTILGAEKKLDNMTESKKEEKIDSYNPIKIGSKFNDGKYDITIEDITMKNYEDKLGIYITCNIKNEKENKTTTFSEEDFIKFLNLDKVKSLTESQVSDYTLEQIKSVLSDDGNDFKIQISGPDSKTKWLNIDKEDLKAIGSALSQINKKIENKKEEVYRKEVGEGINVYNWDDSDIEFIKGLVGNTITVRIEDEGRTFGNIIELRLAPTNYIDSGIVNYTDKFYKEVDAYIKSKYPEAELGLNNTGSIMWIREKTNKGSDKVSSKIESKKLQEGDTYDSGIFQEIEEAFEEAGLNPRRFTDEGILTKNIGWTLYSDRYGAQQISCDGSWYDPEEEELDESKKLQEHTECWLTETDPNNHRVKPFVDLFKKEYPDYKIDKLYLETIEGGWEPCVAYIESDGTTYRVFVGSLNDGMYMSNKDSVKIANNNYKSEYDYID